jgi:predicted DNA-binding protein
MATTEPQVALNTHLPLSLMRRLEEQVRRAGSSKVAIIRQALELYLISLEDQHGTANPTT